MSRSGAALAVASLPPAMPRVVMGLDLSVRATGIAVLDMGRCKALHLERVGRAKASERTARVLVKIRDRVLSVVAAHGVEDVGSELYIAGRGRGPAIAPMMWLHGIVNLALVEAGFRSPLYVAPPTLKKWVTGAGKADKDTVRAALKEQYGVDIEDDNIADAFAVATILRDWHLQKACEPMRSAWHEQTLGRLKRGL